MSNWLTHPIESITSTFENTGLIRFAFVAALSILQLGAGVAYVESTEQIGGASVPPSAAAAVEPKPSEASHEVPHTQPVVVAANTPQPQPPRSIALTIVAIASPFVTLLIGALTIASKHRITEHQLQIEDAQDTKAQEIEAKQKALEIRLALLERGIPCEHVDCPVVEIASGKRPWDTQPPMRRRTSSCSSINDCRQSSEQPTERLSEADEGESP